MTVGEKRQTFSREEPEQRRQDLIQATFRVLAERGYANCGVRAIAEEAGVSIGLIRHYFEEKQLLIAETYKYVSRELQAVSEAAAAAAGDDPRERFRAYVMAGVQPPFLDEKYLTVRFMLWGVALTEPEIRQVHDENYGTYRARLRQLIADMLPKGTHAGVLKELTATVSALSDGLWVDWILRPEDRDIEASVSHCLAMISAAARSPE